MRVVRIIAAVLLASPLLLFGGSYFIKPFPLPPANGNLGIEMLQLMRVGHLSAAVTASHVLIGILLLVPRTRFVAALLQLPITIGILAFHLTMWPEGAGVAVVLLILNLVVLADPPRLWSLGSESPRNDQAREAALVLVGQLESDLKALDANHQTISDLSEKSSIEVKKFGDAVSGFLGEVASVASSDPAEQVLLGASKAMQETQMSFNLQYLQLQSQMQHENRSYTAISNIMKTKHDTVKNSISNIR